MDFFNELKIITSSIIKLLSLDKIYEFNKSLVTAAGLLLLLIKFNDTKKQIKSLIEFFAKLKFSKFSWIFKQFYKLILIWFE